MILLKIYTPKGENLRGHMRGRVPGDPNYFGGISSKCRYHEMGAHKKSTKKWQGK